MILDAITIVTGKQSKKTVIATIMNQFCTSLPKLDPQTLFDQFWQRELLGSTGIGFGVAIPHIRSDLIEETHAVFIRLEQPIDFAGIDKQPVDLIMGLLFSGNNQQRNLDELKQIATFFNSINNRQLIRDAKHIDTIEYLLKGLFSKQPECILEH